ncbi:NUMOD1 domain-containing DNA-binding protein [Convivina intestini]|uniref:NUMOD1 domain-containing DNA-binding protein n=1 Tax=Convivina intestini TaxID=1505726 RepID=UPI003B82DA5E
MYNENLDNLQSFESLTALAKELKISRQTLYKRLEINNLKGHLSFTKEELTLLKKRQKKVSKLILKKLTMN